MKALIKITLLVMIASFAFASCKSDKSKSYRAYYQTINREYAKIRAAQAQAAEMGDTDLDMENPARDEMAKLERDLAEAQAEAQAYRDAFERAFPQQSPAEQPMAQQPPRRQPEPTPAPNYDNIPFKEYSVTPTSGYEDKLKQYNVVVATLSRETGVERLKNAFASTTREDIVVVRNPQGLYNFVIGSYSTREEAVSKREQVLASYFKSYSHKDLMNRYGIPFSDTWILINR